MKYIFEIDVYTDGDFSLMYVPRGMTFDENYTYTFRRTYKDRNDAIKDILEICEFLKQNMYTFKDYVKESWDDCIDEFIKELKASDHTKHKMIREYISGNYDGTEFRFYAEDDYVNCGFYASHEELELIKNNRNGITREMVKEAVLNLFRDNKRTDLNLYNVNYKTWDMFFSKLSNNKMLSIGNNEEEAIERVKSIVTKDARDFEAELIDNVFEHGIIVK